MPYFSEFTVDEDLGLQELSPSDIKIEGEEMSSSSLCKSKSTIKRVQHEELKPAFDPTSSHIEIGIDEAGRGPLFGRLYVAAVVLPKGFTHKDIKDSKKLSDKKIQKMAAIIKETAIAWSIQYIEHDVIDEINIRQAVFRGMHAVIKETISSVRRIFLISRRE